MNEPPPAVTAEYYDQVRRQIEHEDNLITQRLSWLMASQSFLFSAYAIVLTGMKTNAASTPLEHVILNFYHFLPWAGIISTGLIYASICGGVLSIRQLMHLWASRQATCNPLDRPPIHSSRLTFFLGQCAPRFLPLALIGMWIYLRLESGIR